MPSPRHPYVPIRFLGHTYNCVQDILPSLKAKDRRWNFSRFINVATYDLLRRFPFLKDADVVELFDAYERVREDADNRRKH